MSYPRRVLRVFNQKNCIIVQRKYIGVNFLIFRTENRTIVSFGLIMWPKKNMYEEEKNCSYNNVVQGRVEGKVDNTQTKNVKNQ